MPASPPEAMLGAPDGVTLLALERRARKHGSGLTQERLEGRWLLERIWPRGSSRSADLAGGLLRAFGATLTIASASGRSDADNLETLELINSVRLAGLELRFSGPGRLAGRRPLLLFRFDRLRLLAGPMVLLERQLPALAARSQPFFALIAAEGGGAWLAARGRSGGLALWRRAGADEDARVRTSIK